MSTRMLHTPDGVRDVYGDEYRKKKRAMNAVRGVFERAGYETIETPTFEYFDVYGNEVGTTPSKDLFKFFDRDGNTLVLRPDFTPSIARAVSMYMEEEPRPIRISYEGSAFVNSSEYQGRLKETTQMGVELIGSDSAEADAEILILTIEALKKAGLSDFQVSIGEVDFFKSLTDSPILSAGDVDRIRTLIQRKNFFGVEEYLESTRLSVRRKRALTQLPQLFGGSEVLKEAKTYAFTKRAEEAIGRLESIYSLLDASGYAPYVSFDFGSLSKYRYYTGIIFFAYAYGSGEPVAKGGRYDTLLGHFGKDDPAVGFVIPVDQLMSCLSRKKKGRVAR